MTRAEAGRVLAFLNAAFPRDALEDETAMIWIQEITLLHNAAAAQKAARTIGRNGDRFPTLREFRSTYRSEQGVAMSRFQLDEPINVPPPPEAVTMLARMKAEGLRSVDDLPVSTRIKPRPVYARLLRRVKDCPYCAPDEMCALCLEKCHDSTMLSEPTDDEKHDAILILREGSTGDPRTDPLLREAQRIMEEASM